MFDSLRDKFQTVQEGITASFRGLSVSDAHRRSHSELATVNYNAGADLLLKYQTEWSELHCSAEENAAEAQKLDSVIGRLHHSFEKQWTDVAQISSSLATVPQLITTVKELMGQIGMLQGLLEEVESTLFTLEDIVETQELQEKQLEHRFQFALYKEKKLGELESVRVKLASEHSLKVSAHEVRQQHLLRERQETFQQAFREDVEEYQQSGALPGRSTQAPPQRGLSLEEVTLEPEDPDQLDTFLNM